MSDDEEDEVSALQGVPYSVENGMERREHNECKNVYNGYNAYRETQKINSWKKYKFFLWNP